MTHGGGPADDPAGELRRALATGKANAIVSVIRHADTPLRRRQLYAMAQQALSRRKDPDRQFDLLIAVVQAGVRDGMQQAGLEADAAEAVRRKSFVDTISFDLAADLAECWPGDTALRQRHHFDAGLEAARDCVRLRDEIGAPASAHSPAAWIRGAHELSLGRGREASSSFERALDFARRAASSAPAAVQAGGDFQVILASGALGLATHTDLFRDACAAFDETAAGADPQAAARAKFGAAQLRWFAERLADPARPEDLRPRAQ
jgi:3',5'-cyclic AMP phosphodiesterase CpdA